MVSSSSSYTSIYYLSDDVMIYPSSNSNDGGEDNSEVNLKTITDKLAIKSFVIKRKDGSSDNYFKLSPYYDPSDNFIKGVSISSGECSINGYYFNLKETVIPTIRTVPGESEEVEEIPLLSGATTYVVFLQIFKDGVGHIRGDGLSSEGKFECKGVKVCLGTQEYLKKLEESSILPIGYFRTDGSGNPPEGTDPATKESNYHLYDTRFSFIDSEVILTSSSDTIENWVGSQVESLKEQTSRQISEKTGTLSQINYYSNENSYPLGTPTSTLKLTSNPRDLIFTSHNLGSTTDFSFNIVDIEDRTHVSTSGLVTSPWEDGKNATIGQTYNGVSKLLARADHNHDPRYLKLSPTTSSQEVVGSLRLTEGIETRTGFNYIPRSVAGGDLQDQLKPSWKVNSSGIKVTSPTSTETLLLEGRYKKLEGPIIDTPPYTSMDITLKGNFTSSASITASTFITSGSNDYAELYRKFDELDKSDEGTVICKVQGSDKYRPSTYVDKRLVVGIVTESYSHIVGGDQDRSLEENLKTHYAVSLVGRVKVKVVPGIVIQEGDLLSASDCGRAEVAQKDSQGCIIGKALESSNGRKDKILVQVMLK